MRRMFKARLSVTLMGRPSGTATTMRVTAIMKYCSVCFSAGSQSLKVWKVEKS